VLISFLALCSIGIIRLFQLPWDVPLPPFWGTLIGIILLAVGFPLMINALKTLTIRRAFGQEIHTPGKESKLVTTGIYAYTRNPIGFSSTVLFLGWFFIFRVTFLLILTALFAGMVSLIAKWEETELTERFGEEYRQYKKAVPFFIPRLRR
jgi:protein-S-isoprenylcysteine O-methyltransferase Ste14